MNDREYRVAKYETHEKMEAGINAAARDGWEPLHYSVQAVNIRQAVHFVILARPRPTQ
jgi:hypothetical protein